VFLDALDRMPDNYECHSIYNMIGEFLKTLQYREIQFASPSSCFHVVYIQHVTLKGLKVKFL